MATEKVKVPINGNEAERNGWLENISQYLSAGKDVEFVDRETGVDINISRIIINGAGNVTIWEKGCIKADGQSIALTAGEVHNIGGIHGINISDTSATGIHVKI